MMKTAESNNRTFVCKRCGQKISERRSEWQKKPQKHKRVCNACLRATELARQTARERAECAGYSWF